MTHLTRERTTQLLDSIGGAEVAVLGDVMLDRYFWGTVSRVSPEAPVPVVDVDNETLHLGGAANVARNLLGLGAYPVLCGVVGDDGMGKVLHALADEAGMDARGIVVSGQRPTTVKTRVIGNNQQIVRLDRETRVDIDEATIEGVVGVLETCHKLKGIILEDYNKGFLTPRLLERVKTFADVRSIPVFIDPKRHNFWAYKGAYLVKPNRKEAQEALNLPMQSDADVRRAGEALLDGLQCENVLITLGASGMMLFERDGSVSAVPTLAKNVADVSGAGDTVIATLAAMVSGGANIREASALANVAAGVVVAEPGIVSITPQALLDAVDDADRVQGTAETAA